MKKLLWPICFLLSPFFAFTQGCPHLPVVMIHGFLGAGDDYSPLASQLAAKGYCPNYLYVYDWNTLARNTDAEVKRLDSVIAAICKTTGATQVDLVGHSAGGTLAYSYLNDSLRSQRVAHYIHIGSRPMKQPAGFGGKIPTLNIYSSKDRTIQGSDIPGAKNSTFNSFDHFGLVTADSVANAVFGFIQNGNLPAAPKQRQQGVSTITLRVIKMGENIPDSGAALTYQRLNQKGEKIGKSQSAISNPQGEAQLQNIDSNTPYLISCQPISGRPVAYFYPTLSVGPVPAYLRTLPATGMVNMLLGGIPKSEEAAALVFFNARSAISPDRDILLLNGDTLNTATITPLSKTVVALFLYDNGDKKTSQQQQGLFGQAPFMNGVDYYIPATGTFTLQWQQSTYTLPAIPSKEYVTVIVL
jgi:pimeloyl-ACP methyl ester carboxylesterase